MDCHLRALAVGCGRYLRVALVAIIQAIVSSGSLAQISGSIFSALGQIKEPVKEISSAAALLNSYSERIDARTAQIERHLTNINAQEGPQAVADGRKKDKLDELFQRTTKGATAGYYACLRSFETGKAFDPILAFPGSATQRYVQGVVAGLKSTNIMSIEKVGNGFRVTDLKDMKFLAEEGQTLKQKVGKAYRAAIDEYFEAI